MGGRKTWLGILALVGVLGMVEIAAIAFIGHAILPAPIAWALDVIGIAAFAASVYAIASVTWRQHLLTNGEALLVLGHLGQIRVPLERISQVEAMNPLTGMEADRTGPTFVDGVLNLAAAAGVPRVRVHLLEPLRGRRLWQVRPVTIVEVTDGSGELAGALGEAVQG